MSIDHPLPPPPHREPVSWALVLGLGSLALLWLLAELTGVPELIGRPATVLLDVAVVALVWVTSVGLARVPRPVLTLTLAGAVYGVILNTVSVLLILLPQGVDLLAAVLGASFEIVLCTALGAVAGLLARALQRVRGPR
jgi:hypothetical protein